MQNIYEQQYQMSLFLREYYQDQPVAVNDIGAVSYVGSTKLLDVVGLGSLQVFRAVRENSLDKRAMDEMTAAEGIRVAILYDRWFQPWASEWTRVGQWRIDNNVIAGDDIVSFYAVNAGEATQLAANLQAFSTRLPAGVRQSGGYIQ